MMIQSTDTSPADQSISSGSSLVIEGLYVHIPFCFHKCHYCDFYSLVEDPASDRQAVFTEALIRQIEFEAERYQPQPRTIFVGGGTPTLLRPELWQRLLNAIKQCGLLENVVEFTVEANPETVTSELAEILKMGGVNRVSIGAQSFDEAMLKQLERWHDPANVSRAMGIFHKAGITNQNLDLIFAIPTQTLRLLESDLARLIELNPAHVSCYSLIFEANTPLTKKLQLGRVSAVGEETERAMYERVIECLADAGYEHYEISNWSKHGQVCEHNLIYWRSGNWLAVGPSASGHLDGLRWKVEPKLSRYIEQSPVPSRVDEEQLPPDASLGEQLMMRLRLREGIPLAMLEGQDARWREIEPYLQRNLIECSATHLRLTHEGLFIADAIAARLL